MKLLAPLCKEGVLDTAGLNSLNDLKRNFSKGYIYFLKLLLILLTGLQTQIHSRFGVLDKRFMNSLHNENKPYQTDAVFLLVLPLIVFPVVFPKVGRSMVREALRSAWSFWRRWLPWLSAALLCCRLLPPSRDDRTARSQAVWLKLTFTGHLN